MNWSVKVLALVIAGAAGFGVHGWWISRTEARRAEENAVLAARTEAARQAEAKAVTQRDAWQQEARRLQTEAEEVLTLRAEVTRLKGELAKIAAATPRRGGESGPSEGLAKLEKKGLPGDNLLAFEAIPTAVQATILREMEHAAVPGVYAYVKDGQTVYGLKGQLADKRSIALQVGSDGTVLERNLEVPWNAVPASIQEAAAAKFGDAAIGSVREISEGDSLRYEIGAKNSNTAMQLVVQGDGTVLGYSAKFRLPEKAGKGRW